MAAKDRRPLGSLYTVRFWTRRRATQSRNINDKTRKQHRDRVIQVSAKAHHATELGNARGCLCHAYPIPVRHEENFPEHRSEETPPKRQISERLLQKHWHLSDEPRNVPVRTPY